MQLRGPSPLCGGESTLRITAEVIRDGPRLRRGPHYAGPSTVLDIPSRTFYAILPLDIFEPRPAGALLP